LPAYVEREFRLYLECGILVYGLRAGRAGRRARDASPKIPIRPNSGYWLDAAVRAGARDRGGLERLLRYCARPTFALECLELLGTERVV
jgi:hypothetical protein